MYEHAKQEFGQRVKEGRRNKGLTQAQLAEATNKTVESISKIERGVIGPQFSTLTELAEALEMPLKDFFDFEGEPPSDKRSKLLMELNKIVGHLDDDQLDQLLRLAGVLKPSK